MSRKLSALCTLAAALVYLAMAGKNLPAQDAKSVIAAASQAMGADDLKTIQFTGSGSEYSFGQAYIAGGPWPAWPDKSYTRTFSYETPGWRIERTLGDVPADRKGGGLPPGPAQTVVLNANSSWAQQAELWSTPHGFLKAAAMNNATVSSQTKAGKKYTVVSFVAPSKAKVNGYLDAQNLVARVETWFDNPMLGDTLFESDYTGYKDFGGVKFPTHIVQKQGGFPTLDLTISDVKPNAAVSLQAPQGAGGGGGGPQAASSQKLADGVYLILPAYAALAVDFKDGIVVVEGPQSEARGNAIIAEAKRVIPNKPIKYVINTHNHFDHASGLRAFVAEGATIVTYQTNKAYYEKIFALPHTLNPDRQSQEKKKVNIETVGDKKVLTDGNHTIEIYRLLGSNHNNGLLIAYLPKEKILVEADAFNPPAQPNAPAVTPVPANTANLVQNIDRLKLDVDTIVPVHYPADGRIVKAAELWRAVGRTSISEQR